MESYLYVCRDNVGRSQIGAEYHNLARPGEAASAGTHVDEPGGIVANWQGGSVEIIEAMLEERIDIADICPVTIVLVTYYFVFIY